MADEMKFQQEERGNPAVFCSQHNRWADLLTQMVSANAVNATLVGVLKDDLMKVHEQLAVIQSKQVQQLEGIAQNKEGNIKLEFLLENRLVDTMSRVTELETKMENFHDVEWFAQLMNRFRDRTFSTFIWLVLILLTALTLVNLANREFVAMLKRIFW